MGRTVLRQRHPDPEGATSPIAGRPNGHPIRVWGAFALLLALTAVPVFSTVVPPLVDYPNHLARMHLLAEGGDAFYAVRWSALPNLAQDLIVPPLARVIPLDLAAKLFLVMVFALLAGSAMWLNRIATGGWRLWPLLSFLLLYNRIFLWGFVNYLFGVGVALCGTALWLALEGRRGWLRVLASSLVALACFFSHIAALGFYGLVILGVEVPPALTELRLHRWRALGRRITIAAPQFAVPTALLLAARDAAPAGSISYAGLWRKADLLFSIFDNYARAFDIACFALFIGLIGGLAWTRRLGLVPRLACAAGIVFAAYLLLPSQIDGGYGADRRLPIALFLLVVGAGAPKFPNRRLAAAIAIVAASVLIVRLVLIERIWREADRIYAADLAGIDALPRGSRLAIAHPAGLFHVVPVPEVHLVALAIPRRETFVPTLFAIPGQQPVALRPAFAALAEAAQPERLWAAVAGGDADLPAALGGYDFVAFADNRAIRVPSNPCLAPFFARPTFQIFAVIHAASCTGAGGEGR